MIVLGINFGHCASACLSIDGSVVGLVQEERFTLQKNQVGFPKLSIEALVAEHLGGNFNRIDKVAFGMKTSGVYWTALDNFSDISVHDHVRHMHEFWYPFYYNSDELPKDKADWAAEYWHDQWATGKGRNNQHNYDFSFLDRMSGDEAQNYFHDVERIEVLDRHFGWAGEIREIGHHRSHANYALYGAPLTELQRSDALVLTADSRGDHSNWSVSLVDEGGALTRIGRGVNNTIARLYKFTTLILGMKPHEHEYKVMGLASYSNSQEHIEPVERIYFEALDFRDGQFVSDRPLVDSYFDLKNRLEGHRFDNIAAGLQNWATKLICEWAGYWLKQTGRQTLCYSGGLSMNIKANGELLKIPQLNWLSVPGSGGDESLSAGATFAATAEDGFTPKPIKSLYLGASPEIQDDDLFAQLEEIGAAVEEYEIIADIDADLVAQLLAKDFILARCVGRAEFGARALGNRSILANPSNPANIKKINDTIKNRDFWMPFTPSILAEYSDRYLVNPKGVNSPFMTIGFETTDLARREIVAALHPADFTARPQFVEREINPEYWELIEAFRRETSIAAVLNTSLNLHGEPMNYSVSDAIRTMVLSELDCLLLPANRLLFKKRAANKIGAAIGRML